MEILDKRYKKIYQKLVERNNVYLNLKHKLEKNAKEKFGDDIFIRYELDPQFDLSKLDEKFFYSKVVQQTSLPYSNRIFDELLATEKYPVTNYFNLNTDDKNVFGTYLIAKSKNGKPLLFAFSVVRDKKKKDNFSIKLEFSPQGKTWIDILRLDSNDSEHINYFKNGKLAKSEEEITLEPTPHIHKNSEEAQVLFFDRLQDSPTKTLPFIERKIQGNIKQTFKYCLEYFLRYSGLNANINPNLNENLEFGFNNPLFDYSSLRFYSKAKEFSK